jgi:polycystin 1L2
VDDFWSWSIDKLSPGLRANAWYNNLQPYGLAGYLNDFSSRMVGFATLRQLRVKNG